MDVSINKQKLSQISYINIFFTNSAQINCTDKLLIMKLSQLRSKTITIR